jgi:hypothetical protein
MLTEYRETDPKLLKDYKLHGLQNGGRMTLKESSGRVRLEHGSSDLKSWMLDDDDDDDDIGFVFWRNPTIYFRQRNANVKIRFIIWECIQKFSKWVDNEMYAYNNKHSLKSDTKGYGGKTQ